MEEMERKGKNLRGFRLRSPDNGTLQFKYNNPSLFYKLVYLFNKQTTC